MKYLLQWKDPDFASTDEIEALSKNDRRRLDVILDKLKVGEYVQLEVDTELQTVTHVGGF